MANVIHAETQFSEHPDIEGVWYAEANEAGPTAVVLSRTHPDELDGVPVTDDLVRSGVPLTRGRLYVVKANLLAPDGQHYVNSNLNRRFTHPDQADPDYTPPLEEDYEFHRGQELMRSVLSQADASLDLHGHYEGASGGREAVPSFLITEKNGLHTAHDIGGIVFAFGFNKVDVGGSDGYMNDWAEHHPGEDKRGFCYELGPNDKGSRGQNVEIAHGAVQRFLISEKLIDVAKKPTPLFADRSSKYVHVDQAYPRASMDDYVDPNLRTFDLLEEGQPLGEYKGETFYAKKGQVIFFPDNEAGVEDSLFILGRNITDEIEAALR